MITRLISFYLQNQVASNNTKGSFTKFEGTKLFQKKFLRSGYQMKITITDGNSVTNFDVDSDQMIEDVKALVEAQMGVPFDRSQLYYEGKILTNEVRLNQVGVSEGGLLFLSVSNFEQIQKGPSHHSQQQSGGLGLANMIRNQTGQSKPKGGLGLADMIKNHANQSGNGKSFHYQNISQQQYLKQAENLLSDFKSDESRLSQLSQADPELFECIQEKNVKGLAEIIRKRREEKLRKIEEEEARFRELSKDPMNPEYQRMLEERIQQENIDKNYEFAQEYIPEVFGHINMLYIDAKVNKVPIQAFVDSGAQSTIMSQSLAERCGLLRLVDKRQAGMAVGVGSCKILGRIHAADLEIEGKFLTCAFTVIENNSVEFLLGLDMLKRFNCLIDLKKNELRFDGADIVTKFLSDGEIKKNAHPVRKEDVEPKLRKLMDMGFTKEESLAALQSNNYNEEVAGNVLMQRKYGK